MKRNKMVIQGLLGRVQKMFQSKSGGITVTPGALVIRLHQCTCNTVTPVTCNTVTPVHL